MNNTNVKKNNNKKGKCFSIIIRLVFSAVLVYVVVRNIDIDKTLAIIRGMNVFYLVFGFVLILAGAVSSAVSWRVLLESTDIKKSTWDLSYLNIVGFYLNTFFPTGVGGDFWKGYALARQEDEKGQAVASVIVERLTAFSAVIVLGWVSVAVNYSGLQSAGMLRPVVYVVGGITVLFIGSVIFSLHAFRFVKGIIGKKFPSLSPVEITEVLTGYGKSPLLLLRALFWALVSPLLECLVYALIIKGLNVEIPVLPVLTLVPVLRFLNHVPVSVSSIGVQDAAMLVFWKPLGADASLAFSISLIIHFLRLSVGLFGALIFVFIRRETEKDYSAAGEINKE